MKQDKKSFRVRHDFWLDVVRPDQHEISEYLEDMKHQRLFSKTIRDGVRLIRDLRAGNVDVLCELFPMIGERLQPKGQTAELAALVEQFKAMMTQNQVMGMPSPMPISLPNFGDTGPVKVTAVFDETTARQRTIQHTLAALDDF